MKRKNPSLKNEHQSCSGIAERKIAQALGDITDTPSKAASDLKNLADQYQGHSLSCIKGVIDAGLPQWEFWSKYVEWIASTAVRDRIEAEVIHCLIDKKDSAHFRCISLIGMKTQAEEIVKRAVTVLKGQSAEQACISIANIGLSQRDRYAPIAIDALIGILAETAHHMDGQPHRPSVDICAGMIKKLFEFNQAGQLPLSDPAREAMMVALEKADSSLHGVNISRIFREHLKKEHLMRANASPDAYRH